jgi:hypothetical protein
MAQNVRPPDLVVEQIEPVTRLGFRLVVEFPLQSPDRIGCLQAHRHSPPPHRRQKRTRSQGPSLHRRYPASAVLRPCPTPARTAACAALRPLPSSPERAELPKVPLSVAQWNGGGGLPRLPNPCLDVLCPLPRRTVPVRLSAASRSMRPSPYSGRVGVHNFPFGACSGFTHVTARRVAQPPEAAFVAGLRHGQLPNRTACQLPGQPTIARVGLPPTR